MWFGSMSSNISGPPLSAPILPADVPTLVIQKSKSGLGSRTTFFAANAGMASALELLSSGSGSGSFIFFSFGSGAYLSGSGSLILSSSISDLNCCNKFLVQKKDNI